MQKTTLQVARLLQLPAPKLAENPLDAANARIRLGKPVSSKRVRAYRALVVLIACSLSLPFIYALWSGKLAALGIAVWSLGAIMAFVLIRYLYRTSAFWIVHDGAIRFERLSLKGMTETDTVGGDDIERVDVESGGRRGSHYVIAIRLRTGKKIRSPVLVGKDQTQAVQAEIIRRLRLNPSGCE